MKREKLELHVKLFFDGIINEIKNIPEPKPLDNGKDLFNELAGRRLRTDFKLPLGKNSKRKTCGFHIHPEYESVLRAYAKFDPRFKNNGEALEDTINFLLGSLSSEKRAELLQMVDSDIG